MMPRVRRAAGVLAALAVLAAAGAFGADRQARATSLQASVSTLPNGATLIVSEQRNVPMLLVRVWIDAGSRRDPPGKEGLANLTADLLTEGTETRSATLIGEEIDFIGGTLESSASTDYAEASLRVLSKDLDVGLDLLADVLLRPAFAPAELERRREAVLASIESARDRPSIVADKAFKRALFGSAPYGHPTEGSEEAVARITARDVREFYGQHYRPGSAAVIVVGDLGADEARRRIEKALASWVEGRAPEFRYPAATEAAAEQIRIERPVSQANVVLGHLGLARGNPDFEAVSVMNYILGAGGFSSRLMDSIRTNAGLAYSIASYFTSNRDPGSFQVVLQTKNASVADAVGRARAEIERIRSEPVSEQELEDAKRYLIGSFPLRLDSIPEISAFLAQTWLYGLGVDYAEVYARRVAAVTRDDVLRVARQYLHPDRLIEVIVADLTAGVLPDAPRAAAEKPAPPRASSPE